MLKAVRLFAVFATLLAGTVAATVPFAVVVLAVAWLMGWLHPIQHVWAVRNVEALERRLYVGERRKDLVGQFGHEIPQPDRFVGYGITAGEAAADLGDHLGTYSYASSSEFCYTGYLGVAVVYDDHQRVKSWKRFTSGDGC
jgi:hypothetical protein